jgi:hypothetical protein
VSLDPSVWGTVFPELLESPGSRLELPGSPGGRPILGFRINRLQIFRDEHRRRRLAMTSVVRRGHFWKPGKNVASCRNAGIRAWHARNHPAPAPGCTCGLYACHDLSGVPWTGGLNLFVLTVVAGSGIVVIHERGWRAQFARIVAFSDEFPAPIVWPFGGREKVRGIKVIGRDVVQALEEEYQVPVVPLRRLADVARAAGDFLEVQP